MKAERKAADPGQQYESEPKGLTEDEVKAMELLGLLTEDEVEGAEGPRNAQDIESSPEGGHSVSGTKGTTFKKGDRWYARYEAPRTADGKRQQRYVEGKFATQKAAQSALNTVLSNLDSGNWVEPSDLTVGKYLDERWLPYIEGASAPARPSGTPRSLLTTSRRLSAT